FFFSSRRRHTRFSRDWSSDVCSSDLQTAEAGAVRLGRPGQNGLATLMSQAVEESNVDISTELVNMIITQRTYQANAQSISTQSRSEERRVGKECRAGWRRSELSKKRE